MSTQRSHHAVLPVADRWHNRDHASSLLDAQEIVTIGLRLMKSSESVRCAGNCHHWIEINVIMRATCGGLDVVHTDPSSSCQREEATLSNLEKSIIVQKSTDRLVNESSRNLEKSIIVQKSTDRLVNESSRNVEKSIIVQKSTDRLVNESSRNLEKSIIVQKSTDRLVNEQVAIWKRASLFRSLLIAL
ncbi:hypothetical protein RRG08_063952 [Elysia crispata]|uniref:Uncharacterized protein n=1 Tax=Elysia crispata TaxID=231223 RepID=A0AAE0YED9_9GAST|nr:hypothetical protein RRG08_063952 [Elysia crispata]